MLFNHDQKKRIRNWLIGVFFLLGGIEYGVVIPTLWLFLQERFSANESYYSIVLSAFSFSSLITSPIFGAWIDFSKRTKFPLILGLLFEIGGNFLYFTATGKHLVLIARLLCGIGDGVGAVLFAGLVRTSSVEERTKVFSLALAARQIGNIIGPALNLGLKECNFYIGPFIVDNYRSPGAIMALLWFIMLILMTIFYYDLPSTGDNVGKMKSVQRYDDTLEPGKDNRLIVLIRLWKELLKEEVIVILFTQFIAFFATCALEALVAPMMEHFLGWKETRNSVLYTLIGVEAIVVYLVVSKLSKKIADRWLMVIGLICETVALVLYIIVLARAKPYDSTILPTITVGTIVIVLGIPFLGVGGASLYSKVTDERTQGFLQGIRRSFLRVGVILGSLWGGSLYRHLYILLSVMAGLVVVAEILTYMSFDLLKQSDDEPVLTNDYNNKQVEEEQRPLIS